MQRQNSMTSLSSNDEDLLLTRSALLKTSKLKKNNSETSINDRSDIEDCVNTSFFIN